MRRPENIDLGNWREHPNSQWGFQHVRELIPSAEIGSSPGTVSDLADNRQNLGAEMVSSPKGQCAFNQLLEWGIPMV